MSALSIERLTIDGVRNLVAQRLELQPGASLLFGNNGSGKTSVLEAAYLLGTGRSFRTHTARPLIHHDSEACLVQARVVRGGRRHEAGIRRHRSGQSDLRLDGEELKSLAAFAELLPLVLLDTDGLDLVTGAPDLRRRFMDGALFHVEQPFLSIWRRYQRGLKQRNAGLRHGIVNGDNAWLQELASVGEALASSRERFVQALALEFGVVLKKLAPELSAVTVSHRQGWSKDAPLLAALEASLPSDRSQGFTHVGPHRGDLKLLWDGRPAAEVMSRGQTKLAVAALKLAQGRLVARQVGCSPLYLVDDLAAELDRGHASQVCELLAESNGQVVLTAVAQEDITDIWPIDGLSLFHVEQGEITSVV